LPIVSATAQTDRQLWAAQLLFHRGIVHHSVPVLGLTHLEATAIQFTFAGKPAIILARVSTSRPLIGADLTTCFNWGLQVLMAGVLKAKHVDWKPRLSTRHGELIHDYGDENSGLIFGSESPTTNPFNPSVTPDVLDIVITNNLSFRVYLTSRSALSSDYLPVLVDTAFRSSVQHPPDRSDFSRNDWANFQVQLEEIIPFVPEFYKEMAIDTCVENFSGAVLKALAESTLKRRPRD